jgi:hypothetical protein
MNSQYQQYLQSATWQTTRLRRVVNAGNRCEFRPEIGDFGNAKHGPLLGDRCTATCNLNVHHLRYDTLGQERDVDLEVLCRFHHLVRHARAVECAQCGDEVGICEGDAIATVREAVIGVGGDINKVTLNDVCLNNLCDGCEDGAGWRD